MDKGENVHEEDEELEVRMTMDEGDNVHEQDEDLDRHGDLVRNIGPQIDRQGEGGVRGLKQGDGEDGRDGGDDESDGGDADLDHIPWLLATLQLMRPCLNELPKE